jgi:hypothetical protein
MKKTKMWLNMDTIASISSNCKPFGGIKRPSGNLNCPDAQLTWLKHGHRSGGLNLGAKAMKKTLISAAAMMVFGATGAFANECGLNDRQINAGWTCVSDSISLGTTTWTSDEVLGQGRGLNCAVYSAETTQTVWLAYNPAGNVAEDKTVYGPIETGDAYRDGADRCE